MAILELNHSNYSAKTYQSMISDINSYTFQSNQQRRIRLVVVSKTRKITEILPVIKAGACIFGENRVQEARSKWPALKALYTNLHLRLIGPLQTNKVKYLPGLFDAVDSIDRPELIEALARLRDKCGYYPECLIQVNTGIEQQKTGVLPQKVSQIINLARSAGLKIQGLMCIPPIKEDSSIHFSLLRRIADDHGLFECSMGMSNDYNTAIAAGSTMIRIGARIFKEPQKIL